MNQNADGPKAKKNCPFAARSRYGSTTTIGSGWTTGLTNYNEGATGPGHCSSN